MASISGNNDIVSINCGVSALILRVCDSELFCIDHPKNNELNKSDNTGSSNTLSSVNQLNKESDDLGLGFLCSDISPCGNFLAFCTATKSLCIVGNLKTTPSIQSVHKLARGASKIKYTPKSKDIVAADKSGDVYLFKPENKDDVGKLILGHLSLLLDVLVTPDEQFIITCDRDEKIRVSSFPNGYNIIAYCLGHTEFVSSILFIPHNDNTLVSTSGDGTVRFWDYASGNKLGVCDAFSFLSSDNSGEKIEQADEDITAITDATALKVDEITSLVCVCLDHFKMCLVIKCVNEAKGLSSTICQNIPFSNLSPWRAMIRSNILWIVTISTDNKVMVKAMTFNSKSCLFEESLTDQISHAVNIFNKRNMDMKKNIVNLLFKRKFDYVQEYLKKKDERLEPSIKKCKNYTFVFTT